MLTLSGVTKRYPTGDRALTDIELTLPAGPQYGPQTAGRAPRHEY